MFYFGKKQKNAQVLNCENNNSSFPEIFIKLE